MEPVDHLILLGQSDAATKVFNLKPALDASTLPGRRQSLPSSDIRFQFARSSSGSVKRWRAYLPASASHCREPGNLSPVGTGMHFDARPWPWDPRMCVRLTVIAAIHPNTTPRRAIEIDGVRAPQQIRMHPTKREKSRGDDYRRSPTDRSAYEKSWPWRTKHHERVVIRHVDVRRIDGQNLDIAVGFDDVTIRIRLQVAVLARLSAQTLHGVHDVPALHEHGVAELLGPRRIFRHQVKHRRKREQREYARVPLQIIFTNRVGKRFAFELAVLIGPRGGLGDFVPIGGCRQDLCKQRIRIQRDAANEIFQL